MPRNNSQTWNVADPMTATRLNEFNQDLDDLYQTGSDRLKVWALTGLNVEIGAGNYRIGSSEGIFAGSTETMTDDATNYIMLTAAGVVNISTSGWNSDYLKLAKVITLSGSITSVENWRADSVGGNLSGIKYDSIVLTQTINAADGSVVYSHNLGQTPKKIELFATCLINRGSTIVLGTSSGVWLDNPTNKCIYSGTQIGGTSRVDGNDSSNSVYITESNGNYMKGAVSAISASNFTITWDGTQAYTGTINVLAIIS